MSNYQTDGVIKLIHDTQTFSSGFAKREFVIETIEGKFPQLLKFEVVKDKTAVLDRFQAGDCVSIDFDIRGSEYKDRHYVNLHAWKIEKSDKQPPRDVPASEARRTQVQQQQAAPQSNSEQGQLGDSSKEEDDIPF